MATFTCYLPEELLQQLDEKLAEGPDFNGGRASRSGVIRMCLERYLQDKPTTVKDVFSDAFKEAETPPAISRAESFRRATQR